MMPELDVAHHLSSVLGRPIRVGFSEVSLKKLNQVEGLSFGPECPVAAVCLRVRGDLNGCVTLLASTSDARALLDMFADLQPGTVGTLGAMERQALAQVGNASASLFLDTLAGLSGLQGTASMPAVIVDSLPAVLAAHSAVLGKETGDAVVVRIALKKDELERETPAVLLAMLDIPPADTPCRAAPAPWDWPATFRAFART